jgi:undecaprenyl-diphosphatase
MIIALAVGVVGLLLASILDDIGAGITIEVIESVAPVPDPVLVLFILAVHLLAWLVPTLTVAALLWRRTYRRLMLVVLAAVVAAGAAWGLEQAVLDSYAVDVIAVEIPSWICDSQEALARTGLDDPGDVGGIAADQVLRADACVPGDGFPSTVYIAGLAAGFSALAPWLSRRWRRFAWLLIAVFLLVRTIDGIVAPIDAVLVVALGYAIGAGTVLLFGAPDRRPRGEDIVAALGRHGVQLSQLALADVPARSSTPWFATTTDGDRLFLKVQGPEERAAGLLYRSYRAVRLKGVGDRLPFLTVRREVEHEAAVSLVAWAGGVHTPKLVAAGDVGISSMLLAYEAVPGRSLDSFEVVDDATLLAVWEQVAALHGRRIAHRNLSLGNIVVDEDGSTWLTDFGFAELAADDTHLSTDVAQLLASTAVHAGAERAVAAAAEVLGPEVLAGAAPRLQPAALGSSTSAALKKHKGLLADLQDEVRQAAGMDEIELEKLERISPRAVITALMLGLAFYFLIPQLAEVSFDDIREANWGWFPLIILFSFLTYVGATINMMGSVPDRLRVMGTLEAQVGASFVNRISPVKVGGMATNLRYLQKSGVDSPVAVAGIGVSNVVGFIVHMTLLVVFVTTAGRSASESISLPSGQAVLVGLVVVMTLAGGVMLLPFGRRLVLGRLWPIIKQSVSGIGNVASRPSKLLALFGGSFVVTTSYILALWYSIQAFGGEISFVRVGAVYLAGQALAQAAPTPGGIGAAEAALIAGLTAFGVDPAVAVPAVFLYRFATFWLPVLPGWIAVRHLLRTGAL